MQMQRELNVSVSDTVKLVVECLYQEKAATYMMIEIKLKIPPGYKIKGGVMCTRQPVKFHTKIPSPNFTL